MSAPSSKTESATEVSARTDPRWLLTFRASRVGARPMHPIFAGAIRIPFSTVPRPWKDRSTSMQNWSQGVRALFAVETIAFKSERHVERGQNFDSGGIPVGVRAPEFCNYKPLAGWDFGRIHIAGKRAG